MKRLLFLIAITVVACKNANDNSSESQASLTTAEKIAKAHGFENWNKVKTIEFTFGGKKEDANSGRSWSWNPKSNDVQLTRQGNIFNYNRDQMDSTAINADKAFINDKFWALIPFQLLWDDGLTISDAETANSPVHQKSLNKITITYSNEGGYTPGDAYDIYFDKDYIIREWSFRKGNSPESSLSNTFENYGEFGGLKIAQEHKKKEGDWNLLLRNIKVTLED